MRVGTAAVVGGLVWIAFSFVTHFRDPRSVGGGPLVEKVRLNPEEEALASEWVNHAHKWWRNTGGVLALTDGSLIFAPTRFPLPSRSVVLPHGEIREWWIGKNWSAANPLGSLWATGIFVRTVDGELHQFWRSFGTFGPEFIGEARRTLPPDKRISGA